jgi:hypothetical protein
MALPLKLPWDTAQTRWKSQIDPLLSSPMGSVSILKNVVLVTGDNVINHLLGKTQQGWFLTDTQGSSVVFRTAPFNQLTLTLNASAPVVVSIAVF